MIELMLILGAAFARLPCRVRGSVRRRNRRNPNLRQNSGRPGLELYTLATPRARATIMTYGGIVVSSRCDRNGQLGDVVLGYDNLDVT